MARSCWACGQQNDGGSTHCVNPACGLPLSPDQPGAADTSIVHTRPCYIRMLALPATITMVIVLAAVHALVASKDGLLTADSTSSSLRPRSTPSATPLPGPTDSGAPVNFPLPLSNGTAKPSGPPVPTASAHEHADGPVSGAYHMKSLSGGCFDIGYTSDQTPMVAQRSCTTNPPLGRFVLETLGEGRYRITAVPQRGITAGLPLCMSSPGQDLMVVLDGCEQARDDQILLFVEITEDWYQIKVGDGCVTAMGRDTRTKACGSSQTQRFTFIPIN